jgi:hypothetical protein
VGLRAGPDVNKRQFLTLPGLELRLLGRPARIQSLCRLRYPANTNVLHCSKLARRVWFTQIINILTWTLCECGTLVLNSGATNVAPTPPVKEDTLLPTTQLVFERKNIWSGVPMELETKNYYADEGQQKLTVMLWYSQRVSFECAVGGWP